MVICLIGLSIIVLSLLFYLFVLLTEKKHNYYDNKVCELYNKKVKEADHTLQGYKKKRKFWEKFDIRWNWSMGASFGLTTATIIAIIFLIFTGFKSEGKKDYEEYLLVKETIEYCIDNDITLDNSLLEKSIKLNKEISKHKQDKQNPWLSWFVYNDICEIEEINLKYFKK